VITPFPHHTSDKEIITKMDDNMFSKNPQHFIKMGELTKYVSLLFCFLIYSVFAASFTLVGASRMHSPEVGAVVQPNHFWFSMKVGCSILVPNIL